MHIVSRITSFEKFYNPHEKRWNKNQCCFEKFCLDVCTVNDFITQNASKSTIMKYLLTIAFCLLINDRSRILTFHFSSRLKLHFKESKAIHKKEPEWRWLGRMVQNCNSWVVRNLIDFQKRWHMILSLSAFLFDIHMMNGLIFWGELGFVCILSTGHLSIQYLFLIVLLPELFVIFENGSFL